MHPFLRKVFFGCTHFEEKFSLDAPILRKKISGYTHFEDKFSLDAPTHFEEKFSLDAPILKKVFFKYTHFEENFYMGDPKTVPPNPTTTTTTSRATPSSPWSVGCAAETKWQKWLLEPHLLQVPQQVQTLFNYFTQIKNEFVKKWGTWRLSTLPISKVWEKNVKKIRAKICGHQILFTEIYSMTEQAQKFFCTKMATTFLFVKIFGEFFFPPESSNIWSNFLRLSEMLHPWNKGNSVLS